MKIRTRLFGCGKFRWLCIEQFDRELSEKERGFYRQHRDVCFGCLRFEQQSRNAMNLLEGAGLEAEVSPTFTEQVVYGVRMQRRRVAISYWSPMLAGAAAAGLALIAALQMIARSSELPQFNGVGEARHSVSEDDPNSLPQLVLVNVRRS